MQDEIIKKVVDATVEKLEPIFIEAGAAMDFVEYLYFIYDNMMEKNKELNFDLTLDKQFSIMDIIESYQKIRDTNYGIYIVEKLKDQL